MNGVFHNVEEHVHGCAKMSYFITGKENQMDDGWGQNSKMKDSVLKIEKENHLKSFLRKWTIRKFFSSYSCAKQRYHSKICRLIDHFVTLQRSKRFFLWYLSWRSPVRRIEKERKKERKSSIERTEETKNKTSVQLNYN